MPNIAAAAGAASRNNRSRKGQNARRILSSTEHPAHEFLVEKQFLLPDLNGWHIFMQGVCKLHGRTYRNQRLVLTPDVLALGEPDGDWDEIIPLHEACVLNCYMLVCDSRVITWWC